jgi:microcystin-dependent protein
MTRIIAALLALVLACAPSLGATLLPPGSQQFLDANGKPLAGGTIQFFIPNTTSAKATWKDPAQTVLNANPVTLDSAGRATIYGTGAYRQVVKDRFGNLVWDQLTADTSSAQISWGGTSTGTSNAQVVTAPNFTASDGQIVAFLAGFTNTGQLVISAAGSSQIPVLKDSLSGPVNLSGQEVTQGSAVLLIYDVARGAFHLVGSGGGGSGFGAEMALTAANVTDLGLAASHAALIGGSASISSFGSSASIVSPVYRVRFAGSSTLVHGAALLIPGQGNLLTQAGDAGTAVYLGAGKWQLTDFTRAAAAPLPAGMVAPFAAAACPAGWLTADGSAVSRATYAGLFAVLGGMWGGGDGSSTFGLPDLRGVFVRGLDNGRGFDAGRGFATYQADALQDHTHGVYSASATLAGGANTLTVFGTPSVPTIQGSTGVTGASAAGETRPKNVAVLYCVKT